jgi:hypothetical protein
MGGGVMGKRAGQYVVIAGQRKRVVESCGDLGVEWDYCDSCSGCFEGGEYMGMAHHYPVHPVHGCHVGAGCDECGYHGIRKHRSFVPLSIVGADD